ncbi:MAG: ATP-binding protein, partial [Anaerolineaceae bacterium]|nr:ATP-binding protein [Anaerolineaceae bacterium]
YKASDSGGMGLGLSIAKKLIEAHGGDIQAESQPGHGTAMRINLPVD